MQDTLILAAVIAAIAGILLWSRPNTGAIHELSTATVPVTKSLNQNPAIPVVRKSDVAQKPVAQSEEVPHVYTARKVKQKSGAEDKVIHGVPLQAFIESHRNTLPGAVPAQAPSGVRVFLQCMELKKNETSELSQAECNELVARHPSRGKVPALGNTL